MKKEIEFKHVDFFGTKNPSTHKMKRGSVLIRLELHPKSETDSRPVFSASIKRCRKNHFLWQAFDDLYENTSLKYDAAFCMKALHNAKMNGTLPEHSDYDEDCEYLKSIGLYTVKHEGKNYSYSHGWLYKGIPQPVIKEITDFKNTYIVDKDEETVQKIKAEEKRIQALIKATENPVPYIKMA